MRVNEVMTQKVVCVSPNNTLMEAAEQMKALDVGSLPVSDDDSLVGVITDRDITIRSVAQGFDPRMYRVRDAMTPKVVYCLENQDVEAAAQLMSQKQIRRLPVLDQQRHLVGIVSLGDLAVWTGNQQLVGRALERVSAPSALS